MFLNHEQIKNRGIILNSNDSEFTDYSYNLTIEKIIDMNCNVFESFTLKPQGMAYVVFKEKLALPSDIIGFAHVKTTLTKRGIMATNIGIIDSNYNSYISTLLINFGKTECFLSRNMTALRVTFAKVEEPSCKIPLKQTDLDLDKYITTIKENIVNLDEKFLNLNSIESDVKKSVKDSILRYSIIFAAGSFFIATIFQLKSCQENELGRSIKKYEQELNIVSEKNKLLQEQLKTTEFRFKSIEDSLSIQKQELRKIKKK
jgi:deoxycytidine triphosphate deaminase